MSKRNLEPFLIGSDASIWRAMQAINDNFSEVIFVAGTDGRVLGVITDGDIRRGLLRGLATSEPAVAIMTRQFRSIAPSADRVAVLDLMKSLAIRQLPVLDEAGRLVGLHLLTDLIGATLRTNPVVIMAGGRGTRLRPLTETIPKPMVLVAGRPILERIVLHLVGYGIRHIFLAVNYLSDQIEQHFGDGSKLGCRIEYLREKQEMGTAGALTLLPKRPHETLIVMNGDVITRVDVADLLQRHENAKADLTLVAGRYQHQIPFGVVESRGGRLLSLEEKPTISVSINRGIYALEPDALDCLRSDGPMTMVELVAALQQAAKPVAVYHDDGEWIDVGRMWDLARANGVE